MKIEKKIIYKKEPERDTEFVCQYIVAAGSNTDLFGKNGISHFIEHFLIHLSKRSAIFNDVIIHGFTGFYYTNYYWFVHSRLEAVESFCEFEKIISDVILDAIDEELFINTKKEIEEEIVFYKEKTNKLSNIVSSLFDSIREVRLPIGKLNEVKKIEYDNVVYYLQKYYIASNTQKYLLDNNNNIFGLTSSNIESVEIPKIVDIDVAEKTQIDREKKETLSISIMHYNCSAESNCVKIIFKDMFVNSLVEIIIGEIFMMQLCDYLKTVMQDDYQIEYEKFFMSKDKIYFVFTIRNMSTDNCAWILQKKIEIYGVLQNIIQEKGYKRIISSILNYLLEYDSTETELQEIMRDMINYATLKYESYIFVENKEDLVKYLKGIDFDTYSNFVWGKVIQFIEEEYLRVLY